MPRQIVDCQRWESEEIAYSHRWAGPNVYVKRQHIPVLWMRWRKVINCTEQIPPILKSSTHG